MKTVYMSCVLASILFIFILYDFKHLLLFLKHNFYLSSYLVASKIFTISSLYEYVKHAAQLQQQE